MIHKSQNKAGSNKDQWKKTQKTRSLSDCGEGNSAENKPWEGRNTGEKLLKWPTTEKKEKEKITKVRQRSSSFLSLAFVSC